MAATVFNQAQLELLDMMQWVKSPEALAELSLNNVVKKCFKLVFFLSFAEKSPRNH